MTYLRETAVYIIYVLVSTYIQMTYLKTTSLQMTVYIRDRR